MLRAATFPELAHAASTWRSTDEAIKWFDRIVLNIVLGNADEHALNHLFSWDGRGLSLAKARTRIKDLIATWRDRCSLALDIAVIIEPRDRDERQRGLNLELPATT